MREVFEECGGDLGALGDGPDGDPSAFAPDLVDGLLDAGEFPLGLLAAGGDGLRGLS